MESPWCPGGRYFIRPLLQGRSWGSEREGDRFEVTQQCMADWAWHMVFDTNAVLNAGLCFSWDKCPHPWLAGCSSAGGGPSRQSLEPSHRPTLLSPLESHSATYIVGSAGNPLVPPLLPVFLTGHSLGQLSKEEESHHLITSKSSTYPRMCLSGLLWLMPPWGDTQPHLGGDSFLGRTLIHAEPGLLVCRFSGDVCRVGFLCVSGERRF